MTNLPITEHASIEIRNLKISDFKELTQSMKEAYPQWTDVSWTEEQIRTLIKKFPEGQFVVVVDGKVVGSALSLIVDYEKFGDEHTYMEITANDTFSTHDPEGSVLYGIDVFMHQEYRGMRMGRRLYDARKELCENLNLRAIIFGGRIPGYFEHAESMNVKEYIQKGQK
nr:GNAT family N-acetyltransferase [Membranihabitans marinus]